MARVLLDGLQKRSPFIAELNGLESVIVDGEVNLLDLADVVLEALYVDIAERLASEGRSGQ
jgi:hypothetical protein